MLNFLLDAAGNTADAAQQSPLAAFSMPIMLIAMIAIFYFLMIRPQRKQEKEAQNMRDSLAIGDEVTTIGGIIGEIVSSRTRPSRLKQARQAPKSASSRLPSAAWMSAQPAKSRLQRAARLSKPECKCKKANGQCPFAFLFGIETVISPAKGILTDIYSNLFIIPPVANHMVMIAALPHGRHILCPTNLLCCVHLYISDSLGQRRAALHPTNL